MIVFHIGSRDNFVSEILTRWGSGQSLKSDRYSFTLDLSNCNHEESDIEDFPGDSEDETNPEEKSTPFNMPNDADMCISSRCDWRTVLEEENRHIKDIFMGRIKVRGSTIMQISRYSNYSLLDTQEEHSEAVASELENMFVGDIFPIFHLFILRKIGFTSVRVKLKELKGSYPVHSLINVQ
eukprot:snap_masked-scaffold_45-processed-gene-0.53-mRNA-1 protein AED:1.00 eAED:1.00 QI:0/-1/0/0/-1/1/1/0/180